MDTLDDVRRALEEKKRGDGVLARLAGFYSEVLAVQAAHLQASEPLAVGDSLDTALARVDRGLSACEPKSLPVDSGALGSLFAALAGVLEKHCLLDSDDSHAFLTSAAWFPFLNRYAGAVLPHLNLSLWQRGSCPVCGGEPGFAALSAETRERCLVCSDCGAIWPFKRLCCPFCGNERQELLGYHPVGDGVYRVFLCNR
ncbi:MAG: formate dehydrogenase accessory protein FdhE, partial [Chloroflexi bacterium]|nr:formate dehydrogenase accessory protein FdhE [Chloroflexota bacterium]